MPITEGGGNMSEKVSRKRLKISAVCLAVMIAALAVAGILELAVYGMSRTVGYTRAGERWASDGSQFAVIEAFTESGYGFTEDQLMMWERSVDSSLTEASVSGENGADPWTWCASLPAALTVNGPKGSSNAEVTVTEGEFFVFHDMRFIAGSGYLNDKSNPMGVVIDTDLAWKIFGAENIVGMTLTVNGEEYTVTGVADPGKVREVSGKPKGAYGYTYGTAPRMYMSYAGYSKIASGGFTTYEAVIPNPVRSFARNIFDGSVSVNGSTGEITEATERFSVRSRFENMKKLKYSWISVNRIEYPYWENEARVYDYRCAVMMIFEVILASLAAAALLTAIVSFVTSGYSPAVTVRKITEKKHKKKPKENRNED